MFKIIRIVNSLEYMVYDVKERANGLIEFLIYDPYESEWIWLSAEACIPA